MDPVKTSLDILEIYPPEELDFGHDLEPLEWALDDPSEEDFEAFDHLLD